MDAASFLLIFLLYTSTLQFSASLILPITKHASTNQYFIKVGVGTRPEPISLLVDLSNPTLWLDCASVPTSITQIPIQCLSLHCSTATTAGSVCSVNHTTTSPQPCVLHHITNPISNSTYTGKLVGDTIIFGFETNSITDGLKFEIEDFLLTCVDSTSLLLHGLPTGVNGVFGLGKNSRISSISQIAHKLNLHRKFTLCLPSKETPGAIFTGTVPNHVTEISRSMVYTPLLTDSSDNYAVHVTSIQINGRKLSLPSGSSIRARISSVDSFSKLSSRMYRTLVRAFAAAVNASLNLTQVENRERVVNGLDFELCYYTRRSDGGGGVRVDEFPVIDLVLQSEMVKWRFTGHNSMVVVGVGGEDVVCLGLVNGGLDMKDDEIVIGAYQIEDNLLEFDLGSGMLGLSPSLIDKGTSCSQLGVGGGSLNLNPVL